MGFHTILGKATNQTKISSYYTTLLSHFVVYCWPL